MFGVKRVEVQDIERRLLNLETNVYCLINDMSDVWGEITGIRKALKTIGLTLVQTEKREVLK